MKRALVLVSLAAVVLSVTAACSDETAGTPIPGAETTTTTGSDGTTSPEEPSETTTTQSSGNSLSSVDPCELLTSAAKSALGVTGQPEPEKAGPGRLCQWRVDKATATDSYTLGVVVIEKLGLDDVVSVGTPQPITVGSRKAVQSLRGGGGVCAVSLEVTAKSRVDVQASGGDGATLCAPALDAAKLVEPELP